MSSIPFVLFQIHSFSMKAIRADKGTKVICTHKIIRCLKNFDHWLLTDDLKYEVFSISCRSVLLLMSAKLNGSQDIDQKIAFYVFNTGSKYRLIFI